MPKGWPPLPILLLSALEQIPMEPFCSSWSTSIWFPTEMGLPLKGKQCSFVGHVTVLGLLPRVVPVEGGPGPRLG